MRTILNFPDDLVGNDRVRADASRSSPADAVRSASSLFGSCASSDGEGWGRWGRAMFVAAGTHALALAAVLVLAGVKPVAVKPPEPEPELLLMAYAPPPPPKGGGVAARSPRREPEVKKPRPRRVKPELVMPAKVPEPVKEEVPAPPVEEPVAPETPAASAEAPPGPGVPEGVEGGVVGGVVGGKVGGLLGSQNLEGGAALTLKQVSKAPVVLEQVMPDYPRRARDERIVGLVLLRVIISAQGRVEPEQTRVLRSIPALDAAAIAAVNRWRFAPALGRDGQPVRVIVDIPVQFSLK